MQLGRPVGANPDGLVELQVPPTTMASSTTIPPPTDTSHVHPLHDPSHFMEGQTNTPYDPRSSVPGTSEQLPPYQLNGNTPSSAMDPDIPLSPSRPTELPANPATSPAEQKAAIRNEHPAVVGREVEKTKAEEREIKGELRHRWERSFQVSRTTGCGRCCGALTR